MKSILFILTVLVVLSARAGELKLDERRSVEVIRNPHSFDEVVLKKDGKEADRFALPRESANPKVISVMPVPERKGAFIVDYYRGASGTKVIHEAYEAWLFEARDYGLEARDHLIYREDNEGEGGEPSFSRRYKVVKKKSEFKLEAE